MLEQYEQNSTLIHVGLILLELVFVVRAILRPHRKPSARIAWVVVIAVVPVLGIAAYILFGETNIGRRRSYRVRQVDAKMATVRFEPEDADTSLPAEVVGMYGTLFQTAGSISGFPTVVGNAGRLYSDSNETVDSLVADIDAAVDHVHLLFYIWLADNNGCKVIEALKRAAERGVVCRVIVDGMGSRGLVRSEHWKGLRDAGVHAAVALPTGIPILRSLRGRVDLRNHRKIVVVDDRITYCGSQNCADPEFLIKPKFAPWVDAMVRFEGPIARQNQFLFASDWMTAVKEDLTPMLRRPVSRRTDWQPVPHDGGIAAQAFGTGPTVRYAAMSEMFVGLIFSARREIVITTPYFVPDEAMHNALCTAAYRGVQTTIIFPERNDSRIVGAASRSYYPELLEAGVKIYEYVGGLLHAKTFAVDGCITLIGSANLDRRSFDLNYENNILLYDAGLTGDVRRLQDDYIVKSNPVTLKMVSQWTIGQRLWNNTIAMLGPLL